MFDAMVAMVQAGFGPWALYSIPQPLLYVDRANVLLEEKVEGESALDLLLDAPVRERIGAAERCGVWLARFHDEAPRLGRIDDVAAARERIGRWTERIEEFGGGLGEKSRRLAQRLEAAMPPSDAGDHRAVHGSCMPEHVIFSGSRTTTIDLDEVDTADPARDVAWFPVSLRRLGLKRSGSLRAFDDLAERFQSTYAGARGRRLDHLPFYEAMECLHRARRDVFKRCPPLPEWAEQMIDEGLERT